MTSLARDLREIADDYSRHRDLLWQFVLRDLRVRYKQAAMGFLWALFLPLLLVGAGVLVRLAMAGSTAARLEPGLIGSIALRSVVWAGFSAALSFGTASLVANATLVGKIYFPREVLPVASVLSTTVDVAIGLLVLACAAPWLGATPSPALLWVPVLLLVGLIGTTALVLLLSAANLFFRDVKYLVQAMLSVGVLLTPVFYTPRELGPRGAALIGWNPLTPLLEGLSLAVFRGHDLSRPLLEDGVRLWSPASLGVTTGAALLGLLVASLIFHRAEALFAERV